MAIFNTVYGGEWKRKPWANTWCYLPLENNLTDESWNWNSWSLDYSPNISYVSNWYINVAQISWKWIKMPNLTVWNGTTISFWFKSPSQWQYMTLFSMDMANDDSNVIIRYQQDDNNTTQCSIYSKKLYDWKIVQTADFGNWHHYCIVISSNNMIVYIDWQQYATHTVSWSYTSTYHTIASERAQTNGWTKLISKYIIETVARTSSEVSKYYNSTKWLY